jgi:hypothetical protein
MKYPYVRILFVELNREVRQESDYVRRHSSALTMPENFLKSETYDNFGFGGGWGWRRFGGYGDSFGDATTTEQDYKEGTLVVDIFDAKSKQVIWRGSAEGALSDSAAKNEKNLDKGVAKMFKEFPPGSGKR